MQEHTKDIVGSFSSNTTTDGEGNITEFVVAGVGGDVEQARSAGALCSRIVVVLAPGGGGGGAVDKEADEPIGVGAKDDGAVEQAVDEAPAATLLLNLSKNAFDSASSFAKRAAREDELLP